MKIGIDVNEANTTNRVGSNQYAYEIIKAIESIDQETQFTLYSSKPIINDLPAERSNWHYRVIPPAKLWTQWRLPLDLYTHSPRPDVFFTPGHYSPRVSPVPTVVSVMDLAFLYFPNFFRKKDAVQLASWTKYSVKKATHIITISESSKKDIVKNYKIPSERITIAYPGFDQKKLNSISSDDKKRIAQKYNLNQPYIFYLGTLQPRKNLVRLVEAFEQLPKKYDNIILVLSGKTGWLSSELVKKINNSPKKDRIQLTGFVDTPDIPTLYSGSVCLTLIGLYEGFGIPALEAIACGTVPVVANTASLPEVVGSSGILVDPYDVNSIRQGLEKALQLTPQQKKNLLDKSKSHTQQFDWQISAKKILKVLYEVAIQRQNG